VRRTAHLALVLCVLVLSALAALVTPTAHAAERMWVGFHDDPSFRWVADRADRIRSSAQDGSTMMRLLVHWNTTAPTRPASPTDPFDPAYHFDDLDEAVRNAQANDLEVMITISGTPRWANGGKTPNVAPRRMSDFQAFARAIASRYSGRNDGIPFVRFWSIWNEPNLTTFLKPQFNAKGKSVAPATYARIAAAGVAGVKAGNPLAKVAIGETSARGRDKRVKRVSDTHSPGKFAELVAKANKRLRFDGWAHHPYPFNPNSAPSQVVKWPNVSLASLPRFQKGLAKWFKRKNLQIWVTEYGHQTRPQDRLGVTYSTQATYIKRAIDIAKRFSFVPMFIWFVYQDSPGQPWESGLYTTTGAAKAPSPTRFRTSVRSVDARNAVYSFPARTASPLVAVAARKFCVSNAAGTPIEVAWRVQRGGAVVGQGTQTVPLRADCTLPTRLTFTVAKGSTYVASFTLSDGNATQGTRTVTIRGKK
jgi:Cellulase (glycosyl hydrolase family 5)